MLAGLLLAIYIYKYINYIILGTNECHIIKSIGFQYEITVYFIFAGAFSKCECGPGLP